MTDTPKGLIRMPFQPWADAWQRALYGERGFYRQQQPRQHFRTSVQDASAPANSTVGPFALAISELAQRCGLTRVVDLGCGRGELLESLRRSHFGVSSPGAQLLGVDVVTRPTHLDDAVSWLTSPGAALLPDELDQWLDGALVIANEWLDNIPTSVVQSDQDGRWCIVEVDPDTGDERVGEQLPITSPEAVWLDQWWPLTDPGQRAEVGLTRDTAWANLVGRATSQSPPTSTVFLAIDYTHPKPDRPWSGTLTGYRAGRQCPPIPDGSVDVTAHVALDAVAAAGIAAGATKSVLTTQRVALRSLGLSGKVPNQATAVTDPVSDLAGLVDAGTEADLITIGGLGEFGWLAQAVEPGPVGQIATVLARLAG